MKKHLSSLVAGLFFLSAAAFAQDGTKARKTQEPVKVTTTSRTEKAEKVQPAPTATTQAAPAPTTQTEKRKPTRKPINKNATQDVKVGEVKAK